MKTNKWSDLRAKKMAELPGFDVGVKAARQEREHLEANFHATLAQLRRARAMTQVELAEQLETSQSEVSRVEHQTDLFLSTLRAYVEGVGGELVLMARFPGGEWAELSVGDLAGDPDEDPAEEAVKSL